MEIRGGHLTHISFTIQRSFVSEAKRKASKFGGFEFGINPCFGRIYPDFGIGDERLHHNFYDTVFFYICKYLLKFSFGILCWFPKTSTLYLVRFFTEFI